MYLKILSVAAAAFAVCVILGRGVVPWLRQMKAGQSIKEDGPTWHMSKQGTPTMGGVMFIAATAIALVAFGWRELADGHWGGLLVFLFALVFGVIGVVDDYAKIKKQENTGLSASQKFLLQLAAAIAFTVILRVTGYLTPNLYIPFVGLSLHLPWWLYMVFAAFVMVATVNAVNITDGVDGLATGVTLPVTAFFGAVAVWGYAQREQTEYVGLALLAAALFGALAGFLVYNFHPAKVFMGDTGSLFLGGTVCGLAFALDLPLVIPVVGLVYVAETLSDIIQVAYFKATGGKRIFRMAPLHHHFEMEGWSEEKLFFVFTGITLVCCIFAYLGVMDRFIA